ncbi:MAG: c-type cytochrome [Bacteroidota bacterium]
MNILRNTLILSIISAVFISCGSKSDNQEKEDIGSFAESELTDHPGYKLYQTYCIACHGNAAGPDARIAPPAFMIKERYDVFDKEDFIERVVKWVEHPSDDKSMMPGAVRNFDLMPQLQVPEEDREKIAEYFYLTDFEEPAWFDEHMEEEQAQGRGRGRRFVTDSIK